jgi:hypothetical protein
MILKLPGYSRKDFYSGISLMSRLSPLLAWSSSDLTLQFPYEYLMTRIVTRIFPNDKIFSEKWGIQNSSFTKDILADVAPRPNLKWTVVNRDCWQKVPTIRSPSFLSLLDLITRRGTVDVCLDPDRYWFPNSHGCISPFWSEPEPGYRRKGNVIP